MTDRDPVRGAPALRAVPTVADILSAPSAPAGAPPPPEPEPDRAPAVPADTAPVKVGPGWGERLGAWAAASFTPPEIWAEDRPSLAKQYRYAREGSWGPREGWHRVAAMVAFWGVSFPTSAAAYAIEWVGERPARWVAALVLISLAYQLPYIPEIVGALVRVPAWPITATWSLLGYAAP